MRLAVLASGSGSNLQAILDACAADALDATVVAVVSDRPEAQALVRAARAGVPLVAAHPRGPQAAFDRRDWDTSLADIVSSTSPDWVVLAGFMRVLTSAFLDRFPGRVINLHPARPGELAGVNAVACAFDEFRAGRRSSTGVMVHLVPDEGVDDGPVLAVEDVPICASDTLETLTARVHAVEHRLLISTLTHLSQGGPFMNDRVHAPSTGAAVSTGAAPLRSAPLLAIQQVAPRQGLPVVDRQPLPTGDDLFDRFTALTFDDVVVVPGYSEVLPADVDTSVTLARDIRLRIPILSAAMDRVTESRMAIALAREGGIGVIHRNLDPEDQAAEVRRVKRSQSGMITDPVTVGPFATVAEADGLMARFRFSGVPVVGPDGLLIGIITNRDIRFLEPGDERRPVTDFMTSEGLITASTGTTMEEAKALLRRHRIEKLPLVDDRGHLTGLITVKDLAKHRDHPHASLDERGRLRVAAAVGVGADVEKRVDALVQVGVDAVALDTAHGHSKGVIDTIAMIRGSWPDLAILAGNVVTADGVEALVRAGADAVKVGVGAGSICTTRVVAGAGMPQLSAINEASRATRRLGIALIGDGGVTYSGDLVKAIAAGANLVMLGSVLAGTDESPGEFELYEGRRFKSYRGMGSLGALSGRANDRYATGQGRGETDTGKLVPEGIEGRVPYSGSLGDVMHQMVGGLRAGMGYAGAADLHELSRARLMRVTAAGRAESHPHDVQITKEAPNYSRGGL